MTTERALWLASIAAILIKNFGMQGAKFVNTIFISTVRYRNYFMQ